MATARRIAALALVAAMALALETNALANEDTNAPGELPEAAIVVHLANHAGVAPDVLAEAMNRVALIYKVIGVHLEWNDRGVAVTGVRDGELHLNVLMLSRDMREKTIAADGRNGHLLGYAHLPSGRAYVFPDRIAALPGPPTLAAGRLGDVIGHEVGHLVLGTRTHSSNGIMRPSLGGPPGLVQSFNGTEARTIRAALMASK